MIIYTVTVKSAGPAAWYRYLIDKEVDVVETTTTTLFGGQKTIYRVLANRLPVKFIRIEDTVIISKREATNAEMRKGEM